MAGRDVTLQASMLKLKAGRLSRQVTDRYVCCSDRSQTGIGCNDKASYGYGEGQNTECSEQLEGMPFNL